MRPLLGAVNLWLFEGIWTGVLESIIQYSSLNSISRDRSYWLGTFKKQEIISPFFIRDVDNIVLIGKSLNLLRLLCPSHHVFQLDYQDMTIQLRDLENIIKYEHRINSIQLENENRQFQHEEKHFNEEIEKREKISKIRKAENEHRDKTWRQRTATAIPAHA